MQKIALQLDEFNSYDRLAELAEKPAAVPQVVAPLASEVAADLRHRLQVTGETSTDTGPLATERGEAVPKADRASPVFVEFLLVFLFSQVGAVGIGFTVFSQYWWLIAIILSPVITGALAVMLAVHKRKMRRHRSMVARSDTRCLACGYGLQGLPDSIPHEWIAAHAGPRRCPECGEPWPLVPRAG